MNSVKYPKSVLFIAFLFGIFFIFLLCQYTTFPFSSTVREIRSSIGNFGQNIETILIEAGPWGPVYIFFLYFATTIFMLPMWGFHITCGYIYGTFLASTLIVITQTLSACAAFSVSRYIIRPYTLYFQRGEKFQLIERAIQKDGLKIITLLRLSPIVPFGLNNYLCGSSSMTLYHFALGTFIGTLPGTTAYCYMGATGKSVADEVGYLQKGLFVISVLAALYLVKYVSDLATETLKENGVQ